MFCCMLLCVHSSIAIILMGKREVVALLNLSSWCLVMVERLFLTVLRGCLQFVIVVFPDHTHLLFLLNIVIYISYCISANKIFELSDSRYSPLVTFMPNNYFFLKKRINDILFMFLDVMFYLDQMQNISTLMCKTFKM